MMSIRSLADFNGAPLGGAVTGWHRHRHRPGPTLRVDTTKEGCRLLPGHQRGPTPGHQRGLSHGHGHRRAGCVGLARGEDFVAACPALESADRLRAVCTQAYFASAFGGAEARVL